MDNEESIFASLASTIDHDLIVNKKQIFDSETSLSFLVY